MSWTPLLEGGLKDRDRKGDSHQGQERWTGKVTATKSGEGGKVKGDSHQIWRTQRSLLAATKLAR